MIGVSIAAFCGFLLLLPGTGNAAAKTCAGRTATIVGTNRQYISDAERIEAEAPKLLALIRQGKLKITQAKAALKQRALAKLPKFPTNRRFLR